MGGEGGGGEDVRVDRGLEAGLWEEERGARSEERSAEQRRN